MTRLERDNGLSISDRRFDNSRVIHAAAAASAQGGSDTPCLPSGGDAYSAGVWLCDPTVVPEVDLDASVRSQVVLLRVVEEELLFDSNAPEAVLGRAFEAFDTL